MAIRNEDENVALQQRLQQQTAQLKTARENQRSATSPAGQNNVDITNTPASQQRGGIMPGDPERAARMDAAMNQLVTGPDTSSNGPGLLKRAGNVVTGAAQVGAGIVSAIPAAAVDYGRQGLAAVTDSTLTPEQQTAARDAAGGGLIARGFDSISQGLAGTKASVAGLIGATSNTPRQSAGGVQPPEPAVDQQDPGIAPASTSSDGAGNGYMRTGIGDDRQGGGIVMRRGAGGVPEFTNDAAAQTGAGDLQAGGMAGVSDGKGGTFAVMGEPGDAKQAMERFAEANRIRGDYLRSQGGLRMSVVGDNGSMDRARDRREQSIAMGRGLITPSTGRAMMTDLAGRDEARTKAAQVSQGLGLTAQKQAQEQAMAASDQALKEQQQRDQRISQNQLEQLRSMMVDPALSEQERNTARQSYAALTTPAKDRYVLQDAVIGTDEMGGPKYGKVAIDVTTGQPVSAQASNGLTPVGRKDGKLVYRDASGQLHIES
ncbi:hypothetical protein N5D83_02800 [Pseudomonas chengduensis]|nr:hypothetical protein [Pseudomonas chengduensis]MDH1865747.1 hypothetical protein [Pseudomonas chengduensis]